MLLRDMIWERIREQFTEEDKAELNKSITGSAICPRGLIIDTDRLPADLRHKLKEALGQVHG